MKDVVANLGGLRLLVRMLIALLAAAAMVVATTPAALAQVEQEGEQEAESGDVESEVEIENTGDNANLCAALLQFANTGNLQNLQNVSQYNSIADDIEIEGSTFEMSPELAAECEQTIEQAVAAGEPVPTVKGMPKAEAKAEAKAGGAEAKAAPAEAKAGGAEAKAPEGKAAEAKAGKAEGKAEGGKAEAKKGGELPRTGGPVVLALLGGAALVGTGILVWRRIG